MAKDRTEQFMCCQSKFTLQNWIEAPKTEKGIRYVPMAEDVTECFRRIIKNWTAPNVEPIIEGYTVFFRGIKTVCLWLPCIGKSICNIFLKSTTVFTRCRCRKLPLMYAGIHFAPTWQKAE